MKIVISDIPSYFLDPDEPVVGCEKQVVDGQTVWRFRYRHCGPDHFHGPGEGQMGNVGSVEAG